MKRKPMMTILRNENGSAIIEFAIIAPVFFLLMMGIIEFGMYMVTQITIESAVAQAGRVASVGSGTNGDLINTVKNTILKKTSGLPRAGTVAISYNRVGAGEVPVPDMCLANGPDGQPTTGDTCAPGVGYIENNGIPGYQGAAAVSLGAPGELIEVRASYPWRVMFPLLNQFFSAKDNNGNVVKGLVIITSSTVVRNEPAPSPAH